LVLLPESRKASPTIIINFSTKKRKKGDYELTFGP
jgi:hypothetical protein